MHLREVASHSYARDRRLVELYVSEALPESCVRQEPLCLLCVQLYVLLRKLSVASAHNDPHFAQHQIGLERTLSFRALLGIV